jgi:hypothetical protein
MTLLRLHHLYSSVMAKRLDPIEALDQLSPG